VKQFYKGRPPPGKKNDLAVEAARPGSRQFTRLVDCQYNRNDISKDQHCQTFDNVVKPFTTPSIPHYTTQFQQNQRTTAALDLLRQADLRLANLQ